jgi:hypothetical protein
MAFWTDATLRDPKRKFRFQVQLLGYPDGATWYAKDVTKPSIDMATTEHAYLNHTFYFPGRVTWTEVTCTLVDPLEPDGVANTLALLQNAGYHPPANAQDISTMSKASAIASLKGVVITQIDADGSEVETWTLNNAFITNAKFSDLGYDGDDLSDISLTIRYDWATCVTTGVALDGSNTFFKLGQAQ